MPGNRDLRFWRRHGYDLEQASRHQAGLAWIPEIAHLIRQHNDANVLVMPGRFIDNDTAAKIMDEFFATPFEGGRHLARVKSIPLSSDNTKNAVSW